MSNRTSHASPLVAVTPGERAFALGSADQAGDGSEIDVPSLHVHPDMVQIILATSGIAECELDGLHLSATAPSLITVPGGAIHGFGVEGDAAGWAITIAHHKVLDVIINRSLDLGLLLRQPHVIAPCLDGELLPELAHTMQLLCKESMRADIGSRICVEALQQLALVQAARIITLGRDLIAQPSNGLRDLFLAFRDLVERNFETERRVGWYVERLRCNPARLNKACGQFADCTAKDVILDRLVEEARRRLIFTRRSATRIGYDLGFAEPAYFLRFFRQRTGMTPATYRATRRPAAPSSGQG